jgi:dihydroorotase
VASQTLTIRRPDDWHVHLRDGEMLAQVAPYTARQFARAIVMPNLVPPIAAVETAREYRKRILEVTAPGFTPLMTCYLTDNAEPDEIARGFEEGLDRSKLYPAGATTNSASGVTDIRNIYPSTLTRMERIGMVLCVHGGHRPRVDVFDREAIFIDRVLSRLVRDFPSLRIVLEHITPNR